MTPLSDKDWDMINAWSDKELPKAEMRYVDKKIKTDAAWAEAAASIQSISTALGDLRPSTQTPANNNRALRIASLAAGAVAACAFAVFIALPTRPISPDEVHQSYLSKNFPLSHASNIQSAAAQVVDGFPTLSEANLTLVATTPDQEVSSAHYVGKNGCRLTLLTRKNTPFSQPEEGLSHRWNMADVYYLALATDMDVSRFKAISAYLETAVARKTAPQQMAALQDAVQTAAPCTFRQT